MELSVAGASTFARFDKPCQGCPCPINKSPKDPQWFPEGSCLGLLNLNRYQVTVSSLPGSRRNLGRNIGEKTLSPPPLPADILPAPMLPLASIVNQNQPPPGHLLECFLQVASGLESGFEITSDLEPLPPPFESNQKTKQKTRNTNMFLTPSRALSMVPGTKPHPSLG